jgi:hypothetical protein
MVLPLVAQAADYPVRRAAPVVETFSWTGVYIGASGGELRGGSSDFISGTQLFCRPTAVGCLPATGNVFSSAAVTALPITPANTSLRKGIWGGQVGYNHQFLYRLGDCRWPC